MAEARKQERAARQISRRFWKLAGLALFVLVVCPLALYVVEQSRNPDVESVPKIYLWLVRTLLEGDTAYTVKTAPGYVVLSLVQIAGISSVAFVSGAIASKLVTSVTTPCSSASSRTSWTPLSEPPGQRSR